MPTAPRPTAATTPEPAHDWLTFQQFIDHWQVSKRTGRNWIAEGRIPAYRIGPHQIRLRRADVEALAERIPTAGGASA